MEKISVVYSENSRNFYAIIAENTRFFMRAGGNLLCLCCAQQKRGLAKPMIVPIRLAPPPKNVCDWRRLGWQSVVIGGGWEGK